MSEAPGQVAVAIPKEFKFKPVDIKGPFKRSIIEMVRDKPGFKHEPGKRDHMGVPTPEKER